jgi:hypothetical protein
LAVQKKWKFLKIWELAVHNDVLRGCRERGGRHLDAQDFDEFDDPEERREAAIRTRVPRLIR